MLEGPGIAVHHHQAGGVPRLSGILGDERLRKVELEVGEFERSGVLEKRRCSELHPGDQGMSWDAYGAPPVGSAPKIGADPPLAKLA